MYTYIYKTETDSYKEKDTHIWTCTLYNQTHYHAGRYKYSRLL